MTLTPDSLPDDVETLKAMVIAARVACLNAEAEARARALQIEQMKFIIAKLRHERFGQSSERRAILEQLELALAEMEENASQAEAEAQMAAAAAASQKVKVASFQRRRPARRPLPDLMPLVLLIRAYVFAAERIHADETTVKVQAKGQCRTGRLWTYVRDDRPFGGSDPPAAAFFYSPDRRGKHPEEHLAGYAGLMQADAYAGFNRLYAAARKPGPIVEASCWAHAPRQLFDLAR